MLKYFDPIMQEDIPLDETTSVYLVKIVDQKYSIKAISSGLERLPSDPTTHANEYWPIPTITLMNHAMNQVLFEEDNLTTKLLTQEQIIEFFSFNPEQTPPKLFNILIKNELANDWIQQIVQDVPRQSLLSSQSFFQPIFFHHIIESNDHQQVILNNLPDLLVFQIVEQTTHGETEGSLDFFVNILLLSSSSHHMSETENTSYRAPN